MPAQQSRWLVPVLALASAGLGGCAELGEVPDDRVASATLVNLDTTEFAVVFGPAGGDAILAYTTPEGDGGHVPVSVSGGSVGVVFKMSADLNMNDNVELDLSDADPDLTVRDLLGTYKGTGYNVTMGFGGAGRKLRNGHGVRMADEHWTVGAGMDVSLQWLRVRVGGHEDGENDDWFQDAYIDTDDPPDTGETGDTGPSDTGDTVDTVPDVIPPDPTAGPGCGGTPVEDTGGGGSGGSSGCDGGGGGGSNSGCSSGSSGGGSDCGSGCDADLCECSTVGFVHAPFAWVVTFAMLRRRRQAAARST